jgi:hypothetical protein
MRAFAGADPTHQIEDLARKLKVVTMGVSMGQGQEIVARKILNVAATEGHWVLLQNAHLGLAYVSEVVLEMCTLPQNLNAHCRKLSTFYVPTNTGRGVPRPACKLARRLPPVDHNRGAQSISDLSASYGSQADH